MSYRIEMWCLVLCLLYARGTLSDDTASLVIDTAQGPVRGYKDPNEDIFVFYGIPYATAPTGSKKFKGPLPPPVWSEPYDAVDNGIICPQRDYFGFVTNKIMKEDCLIANIYVPNTDEKNLTVAVYIHGGGFILGYGDLITPKKLVSSKRIIAVTFNYRLAAHGFLCLGTEDVPGNGGMKDQVALLRWVQDNIENFGGNPQDVTITGWSAGASSAGLLMVSKMAKGLFNKVIPESGDILSSYSVQVNPIKNAREYAKLLQFNDVEDINVLESFFKNLTYDVLQSANIGERPDFTFLLAPCVEQDIGEEMFLEDDPLNVLINGDFEKLPMLYGFTNMEGLMRIDSFDKWKVQMNTNFEDFIPSNLQFPDEKTKNDVINSIRRFYFHDKCIDNNAVLDYIYFITDVMFSCPSLRTIQLLVKAGNQNIYLCEYSHVDNNTPLIPYTSVKGSGHCGLTNTILDEADDTVLYQNIVSNETETWKAMMREIWLNFMTNGKPESCAISKWLPVKDNASPYMAFKQCPELRNCLLKERCRFWDEIYDKYYQKSIPPSKCLSKKNLN